MIRPVRWAMLTIVACAVLVGWQFKLFTLAFYWVSMKQPSEWQTAGIWLPYYRVTVDARTVEGVSRNLSGLTFNKQTGTLFSIINNPPEIVELSTEGAVLRRIPVIGASDTEAITHVKGDFFVIADERSQQLYFIRISATTENVDVSEAARLGLAIDLGSNQGFEGVSWDATHSRLYVAKEKSPMRVLTIDGLPELLEHGRFRLQIGEWKPSTARTLFMTDLSSLSLHERTGNLLLLSDESALIVEYTPDGTPVSMMPMWAGLHGLSARVPQAEGITLGPDGTLYVLSEPNLFYRFERSVTAEWAAAAGSPAQQR
jgi:uncharacterized protein YjiK